jgi:biopolymer transport protein ExbD
MARPKLPRKSTIVDMTAMCDVAFLLLSFFILTTKFKPAEAVPIETPNSVQAKPAPEKNFVMVSIDKDGKVFLMMDDNEKKKVVINELNKRRSLGLSDAEVQQAISVPFYGTPVTQLKSALQVPKDKYNGAAFPGIPAKDSTNNEMLDWMSAITVAYAGQKINQDWFLLLKGDMNSKYPAFRNIITAFKKNDLLKFQMVTNPESVPEETELFKTGKRE